MNHVKNGQLSDGLYRSLRNAKAIANVPGILRQILQMRSWEDLLVQATGEIVSFNSFAEYVTTHPPEGLGTTVAAIRDLIPRDDIELLAIFDEATQGKPGNRTGNNQYTNGTFNNIQDTKELAPVGTSAQAGLRRLRKLEKEGSEQAKELRARVLCNEVSVNAALVELGIRTKTVTIPVDVERAAAAIKRHFTQEQIEQLRVLL